MSEGIARLAIVEQLRGLAALSVCWFHLTNQYGDWVRISGEYGWLGVEAFFVISGLVIPLSLARDWARSGTRAIPGFLLRRFVRIEPPYMASVLLVVLINLAAFQFSLFDGPVFVFSIPQIFMHAAYLIPLTNYQWLQPVYWTLAYEFVFYLTIAIGIGLISSKDSILFGLCYALFLSIVVLGYVTPLLGLFGMGLLVFRTRAGFDPSSLTALAIGLTGAAMILEGYIPQAVVGLLTACLIYIPNWSEGVPNLAGFILNKLGKISFSLYLFHVPIGGKIVNLGKRWLTTPEEHFALSLAALGVSLLAAAIFWRLVELPCLKIATAIGNRQRSPGMNRAAI